MFDVPKQFVSLHNHSTFSPYDGVGQPKDHIEFVLSNESDSWALTDHGNGNGLAHAHAHAMKLKKNGQKYRQVYGVEFYFVPDLNDWQDRFNLHKTKQAQNKNKVDAGEGDGLVLEDADISRTRMAAADIKRRYHLVVNAKNQQGLQNLFTLVKLSYKDGFYRFPRIDFNMLKKYGEGLVVSTACVGGYASGLIFEEMPEVGFMDLNPTLINDGGLRNKIMNKLENMVDRFTDAVGVENFFLELQFNKLGAQHLTNRAVLELAERTNIPLIVTADAHYPGPDLWEARELYRKLRPGMLDKVENRVLPEREDLKTELYPKNAMQMWAEFMENREEKDNEFYHGKEVIIKEAIERTHDIAWQHIEEVWFDRSVKLPNFDTKESSAFSQLMKFVKEGLVREGLHDKPEYVERTKMEMSDIKFLGFENYFLTLQKILKVSENGTLPGAGRGSGAGSLVNFLLDITHVDPIKYDLLWERFLHRQKAGWPDIDLDIGNRDVVINAARDLFGDDSVIPVSNFNTLKLKSLVKDVSKFYGIDFGRVNKITGPLEHEVENKARDPNMEKSMFILKHEDCMKYSATYLEFMTEFPEVERQVRRLFAQNRSIGRHAGGVLVCPGLEKHMPVIKVRGELQTPWTEGVNIRNLEENGFLKFDFLGLKQMQMVEDCIRLIKRKELGRDPEFHEIKAFYDDKLNSRYHDPDDSAVFENVYQKGKWPGIFQFTSHGARKFCKEAQPKNITELAAITAIYRPGPLKANVHKDYVAARNGGEIKYNNPIVEDVLGDTYGFIVFQEQFMLLGQKLAGFDKGESDKMRKTLVKKDLTSLGKKASEKDQLKIKFVEGAQAVGGMNKPDATKLFDKIAYFSLYGFNKSHAISYAIVSYYGAWLLTHYEKEWLATCLQTENGNTKSMPKMVSEIKKLGLTFAPMDINTSANTWMWNEEQVAFVPPIDSLKGVGGAAVQEIMANRPYTALDDLFYDDEGKWKHSKMNKRCFESLCKVEAFGSLKEFSNGVFDNHNQMMTLILDNYTKLKKNKYGMAITKAKKLNAPSQLGELIEGVIDIQDWSRAEKVAQYNDVMGGVPEELTFPSGILDKFEKADIKPITAIKGDERMVCWALFQEVQKKKTKNGKTFYRIKAMDADNNFVWLKIWGGDAVDVDPYTIWLVDAKGDEQWGPSTSAYKIKPVVA